MSDEASFLWREFLVETSEHIEQSEQLLLAAETVPADKNAIGSLFRAFHSVKGLACSMDMRAMEQVAHRAEDLLGLVREGICSLEPELIALLIASLDALRTILDQVDGFAETCGAPEDLIKALTAALSARRDESAGASGPKQEFAAVDEAAAAEAAAGCDAEMLALYVELVADNLQNLTMMATSEIAHAETRAAAIDAIETLIHASEVVAFDGVVGDLQALLDLLRAEPSEDARFEASGLVSRLAARWNVGGGNSTPWPANNLGEDLLATLAGEVSALLGQIEQSLRNFNDAEIVVSDNDLAHGLVAQARAADSYYVLLAHENSQRLLLILQDGFGRIAAEELILHADLLRLSDEILALLTATLPQRLSPMKWEDSSAAQTERLLGAFRQAIISGGSSRRTADPIVALKRLLALYDISEELLEILSAENVQDLVTAVNDGVGEHIYQILVDMEGDEEFAVAFVAWMQKNARLITNRTVFVDGATWFEFLVVSKTALGELASALRSIDPTGIYSHIHACLSKSSPQEVVPPVEVAQPESATAASNPGKAINGGLLRVPSEAIDQLMRQIGESMSISNMMQTTGRRFDAQRDAAQLRELIPAHLLKAEPEIGICLDRIEESWRATSTQRDQLATVVARLQDATLELRVVALETLFSRLPRVVRDMCQANGKRVALETSGSDVRIDKGIVELLLDPLMHMVRNAVDHGIELPDERTAAGKPTQGAIRLTAVGCGGRIEITMSDDGRGMDPASIGRKAVEKGLLSDADLARMSSAEILDIVFLPGFSTAKTVSSTSGRGVGMDVVRTNIQRLGGSIRIESTIGKGSSFKMQLPMSAAIQQVLLVEAGVHQFAMPERFLAEVHSLPVSAIQYVRGRPAILLREQCVPVFDLDKLLGIDPGIAAPDDENATLLILFNGWQRIAVRVSRARRRQELFVRDIHSQLTNLPGVGGASIAGDGRVVLILDGDDLFRLAERDGNDARYGRPDIVQNGPRAMTEMSSCRH